MRRIAVFLLVILFTGCKSNKPVSFFRTSGFILVDTTIKANCFLETNQVSGYPIYYKGPVKDSIKIGGSYLLNRIQLADNNKTPFSKAYSKKTICIFVDTSVKTNSRAEHLWENGRINEELTKNYHAFLFTVKNISDTAIYMGETFSLYFMHQEAKNSMGEWVKLDKALSELWLCTTGQPTIILRPGELIISKFKRHTGTFLTDFRLAFGSDGEIVYSNTFRDYIDETLLSLEPVAMSLQP